MKIRAVRLREVGIFRDPVAIEGFSGGLDVLAGPNELGKSTILRALERLFLSKPTSKDSRLEQLRPYGGGAPLIEADFEVAGRPWRLRKQFLSGRGAAELVDLTTGEIRERGPEAHSQALALIGLSDDERNRGALGLLWVNQHEGPRPLLVGPDEKSLLLSAIGSEVSDIAAGHALRAIQEQIKLEMDVLVTEKTRKPRGPYEVAIRTQQRLAKDLTTLKEQARQSEHRSAELERLRGQRAALADPTHLATLTQAVADAQRAIEDGRRSREKFRLAQSARREQESKHQQISAAVTVVRDRLDEQTQLAQRLDALAPQIAAAETAEATATAAADGAAVHRAAVQTALVQVQISVRQADRLDALVALQKNHRDAAALIAEQTILKASVTAIAATDGLLRKAESEQRAIETLQAQVKATIDASAPRVSIAYASGIRDAIQVDGQPIPADTEFRPAATLVLDIAGIGRITITPVANTDLAETRLDLQAHQDELSAVLAMMSRTDLPSARAALAEKRTLEAKLAVVTSKLSAIAPDGMTELDQRLAAAERSAEADGPPPHDRPDRTQLADRTAALEQEHRTAIQNVETSARQASQHGQALTRLRAILEAAQARMTALNSEFAQSGDPAVRLARLELECADATAAVNAAVRDSAAWAETAPSDDAWRALQEAIARADGNRTRATTEIGGIDQAIARLEGELEQSGETDIAQKIDELTGELSTVQAQIARYEKEVASLVLLERLLKQSQASAQDQFLLPVLARVEPYLRDVLPEARLRLTDGFTPAGLSRGSNLETAASLSGGTQEQLAVLTRLGFGRLLADRGQPAPVILDDALVYSDDVRIERLFGVLRSAAAHHQVIVLTCRSRVFESLGGTQLSIQPWKVS